MTQQFTEDTYAAGHVGQTDLQNMENNFLTLKSLFSGTSQPSNAVAGMPWYDTSNNVLKIRNAGNTAWYRQMHGDSSQKIWVYRNSAMNGWIVDSSVADVVLSLKGGSQAYDRTGGGTGGTWTQPSHTLTSSEMPSHNHGGSVGGNGGHSHTYEDSGFSQDPGDTGIEKSTSVDTSTPSTSYVGNHSHSISTNGGGGSHNHGTTWRPSAAVGTLQAPAG